MQKYRYKPLQSYKNIQVDFRSKKSRKVFANYLEHSWGFSKKTINTVFNKHSGKIKRYSPEHATLMYELIRDHFDDLSKEEKLGYLTSKKNNICLF